MPRENTQFTSENQPKKNGRKKGSSATDWLRRLSHTKINFQNPITGLPDKAEVNFVAALQLVLKVTQDGDLAAIKEYFDRLDGKVPQKLEGEGFGDITNIYALINRIQQEFISKGGEPSLVLDRGDGVDTGRTRPDHPVQEIPKQRLS